MLKSSKRRGTFSADLLISFYCYNSNASKSGFMSTYEYDIALSMAGEDREFARPLALALEDANYAVFYDEFETARLWGTELSVSLGDIYGRASRHCMLIVSQFYAAKPWTNHERRFAIQRALTTRTDYILPIRRDDTELPGWPSSIAYIDAFRLPLPEIISTTFAKLGQPQATPQSRTSGRDRRIAEQLIQACYRRAVFTRMDSEINMEAMYRSIGECISQVQPLVPTLKSPELQNLGIRLLQSLDDIQRYSAHSGGLSVHLSPQSRAAMDGLKLEAIQLLKRIKRAVGATIQFPTSLSYYHFYSPDEGSQAPSSYEDMSYGLTVRNHLERAIHDHQQALDRTPDRQLTGISPLGEACLLAYEVDGGRGTSVNIYSLIMDNIREEKIIGSYGEEAVYHHVRRFPSGDMVGMVICRPARAEEAFAIVFDDKFPDYFGIFYREFNSRRDAETEATEMASLDGRGESLANQVELRGWRRLKFQ
jgi:TIR domain-containing protein